MTAGGGRWALSAAVLLALAFAVDGSVHRAVDGSALEAFLRTPAVAAVARMPGNFPLAFISGVLLLVIFPRRPDRFFLLAAASLLSSGLAMVFKGGFGRARPGTLLGTPRWVFFRGGWYGFCHQQNVSFVSGDVTQAFAWAEAMSVAFPPLRVPIYAWAILTGGQRIGVGAHWPSDVVGAAILGIVTVRLLVRILSPARPPFTRAPTGNL